MLRAADQDAGHSRQGGAHRLNFRGEQPDRMPRAGQDAVVEMRIIGQHGLARLGPRRPHRPVVRAQALVIASLGSAGKIVPIDIEGRPSDARNSGWSGHRAHIPVGDRRHGEELACTIEAQAVDQLLRNDLGFDIGRVRVVDEMDQGDEIGDAPRLGARPATLSSSG